MVELGVNIDHVATIRQARRTHEPDPVQAATAALAGGADGITVHLREDRRHIQDHDVERLAQMDNIKLNLEMAATGEMLAIAARLKPALCMLVPEGRLEVTTEGGLDVAGRRDHLRDIVARLKDGGMAVSAFIDAEAAQVEAAADVGFSVCEVHTGPYAHALHDPHTGEAGEGRVEAQLAQIADAGRRIIEAGMQFNAGHALNYDNVQPVAALGGIRELHIGHAIVSRAVFCGLEQAVREMKDLISVAST